MGADGNEIFVFPLEELLKRKMTFEGFDVNDIVSVGLFSQKNLIALRIHLNGFKTIKELFGRIWRFILMSEPSNSC